MARTCKKRKVGSSKLVPYIPGESFEERHARRLAINLSCERHVRKWCKTLGLELNISSDFRHWTFRRDGEILAEWWPSTAKLAFERQRQDTIHALDWKQAIRCIMEYIYSSKREKITVV